MSSISGAMSLDEVYQAAVQNTATVKERSLAEKIAHQQKKQALAQMLPTLTAESSNVFRDEADVGAFGESYQHSAAVTLNQPLFQGGGEYYALKVSRNLPKIAQFEKLQAEIDLYYSVAQRFYEVLRLRAERDLLNRQRKTLLQQLRSLEARARIGRNKRTDVLSARSQLARMGAELATLESQLLVAEQAMMAATGLKKLKHLEDPQDIEKMVVPPHWEGELDRSPRMAANRLLVLNAKREVDVARGSYLPTVDLESNYYLDRAGILADSKWDVTLTASWEIFSGNNDRAEVAVQKLELQQLELRQRDLQRNLKSDFLATKKEFLQQQKVIGQLRAAVALTEDSFKEFQEEYKKGLVDTLDVLRSFVDTLEVQRAYQRQIFTTKTTWHRLKAITGIRPTNQKRADNQ